MDIIYCARCGLKIPPGGVDEGLVRSGRGGVDHAALYGLLARDVIAAVHRVLGRKK